MREIAAGRRGRANGASFQTVTLRVRSQVLRRCPEESGSGIAVWVLWVRCLGHRNGRADFPLWDMMEDVTDTEARAGRTSAWRNDPDITDLSVRAALIGRLAGRVADLATDLQLLAMFVQTMADDVATSSAHGEDRRPPPIDHRDPTGNSVAANPSVVGDRHDRPTGEPTLLDPIDRAVQAVDALRRGLSARNSRNE